MTDSDQALAAEAMHKFLRINRYLRQYARQERATVGQIQEYIYSSASAASMLISGLEDAHYVTRTRSPTDNRVVIVELTDAGRTLAERAPTGGLILLRRRLRTLPPEQLTRIDHALADIMELMEMTDDE